MHLSARHVTLPMLRHPSLGTFDSNKSDDWVPFVAPVSRQMSFKRRKNPIGSSREESSAVCSHVS
jgi:hypothetical protein